MQAIDFSHKKIAQVATVPFFLTTQLAKQMEYLLERNAQVTAIASSDGDWSYLKRINNLNCVFVDIPRKPDLWGDLKAFIKLVRVLRSEQFDIVHSTTPKAGLLCALAGLLTKTPVRLHTFTGQVWDARSGIVRKILQYVDKLIICLNTHCYTDSPSQLQKLIDVGVAISGQVSSYGSGSLAGVDLQRFSAAKYSQREKVELCGHIGITEHSFVMIFIGRITRDKGVGELLSAFEMVRKKHPYVKLLMLGPIEDEIGERFLEEIQHQASVHWLGYVSDPEKYLAISDILCLPSYREGFGTVVIEAAAMGVPVIGTQIEGLVDAVNDGVTGLLVPPRDIKSLAQAMETLVCDSELLQQMKNAAKERCCCEFDAKLVNKLIAKEYIRWLSVSK